MCGDAANGLQGVQQACALQPDLIAIDYSMPLMNGIEASTEIVKLAPDIRILLCTMYLSEQLIEAGHEAGIHGIEIRIEVNSGWSKCAVRRGRILRNGLIAKPH